MLRRLSLSLLCLLAIALSASASHALRLDVWNVDELDASDDYIDLKLGTYDGRTTITMQWHGGIDDTPGALGIDKVFINNTDQSLEVTHVFVNAIGAANDVTTDWLPTKGGTNAGGGFGAFVEKVAEPAGNGGVAPNSLIFVLDGQYDSTSFVPNDEGATFAAHVRFGNGCSGWVADGGQSGGSGSDGNCGSSPVPEPSAALAFGAGALVFGGFIRTRRRC